MSLVPLAPISNVSQNELPALIQRMRVRYAELSSEGQRQDMWAVTEVLLGLRYDAAFIESLFQEVSQMRESTIYQKIFHEGEAIGELKGRVEGEVKGALTGRLEATRQFLFALGERTYGGEPEASLRDRINAIDDVDLLQSYLLQIPRLASWDAFVAFLDTPAG